MPRSGPYAYRSTTTSATSSSAARWRAGSAGSSSLASATSSQARDSRRRRARPSPRSARTPRPRRRRCAPTAGRARASSGSRVAGQDQRQRDRAVEQVGAARLAGALGRPGHVEDVVEDLEGEADPLAERAERLDSAVALERPELARGAEQHRGLQPAALEVALDA